MLEHSFLSKTIHNFTCLPNHTVAMSQFQSHDSCVSCMSVLLYATWNPINGQVNSVELVNEHSRTLRTAAELLSTPMPRESQSGKQHHETGHMLCY